MNIKSFLLKYRRPIIVVFHLALVTTAYVLAFYLRLDFKIDASYWSLIERTLPLIIGIKMIVFWYFGLFSGLWRYAGIFDIWRILKVHVLATLCFILAVGVFYSFGGFPRSIFVLDCVLSFCFVDWLQLY